MRSTILLVFITLLYGSVNASKANNCDSLLVELEKSNAFAQFHVSDSILNDLLVDLPKMNRRQQFQYNKHFMELACSNENYMLALHYANKCEGVLLPNETKDLNFVTSIKWFVYSLRGDNIKSNEYLQLAHSRLDTAKNAVGKVFWNGLISNHYWLKNKDSAIYYAKRAYRIKPENAKEPISAKLAIQFNLAILYVDTKRYLKAQNELESILIKVSGKEKLIATEVNATKLLAKIQMELGNVLIAKENFNKAYRMALDLKDSIRMQDICLLQAELSEKIDEPQAAIKYWKKYKVLNERLSDLNKSRTEKTYEQISKEFLAQNKILEKAKESDRKFFRLILIILFLVGLFIAFAIYSWMIRQSMRRRVRDSQNILAIERLEVENIELKAFWNGKNSERESIAMQLHDSLSNEIGSLKILQEKLIPNNSDSSFLNDRMKELYEKTRSFSHVLSPKDFESISLEKAIKELVSDYEVISSMEIDLNIFPEGNLSRVQTGNKENVYLIMIELLQNTTKHAEANLVNINFQIEESEMIIIYTDDGIGLSKNKRGIGLQNVVKRAEQMNAEIQINSEGNKGMDVYISLPNIAD